MSTSLGGEDWCRTGHASQTIMVYRLSPYGLNGLRQGDEHPGFTPSEARPSITFLLRNKLVINAQYK